MSSLFTEWRCIKTQEKHTGPGPLIMIQKGKLESIAVGLTLRADNSIIFVKESRDKVTETHICNNKPENIKDTEILDAHGLFSPVKACIRVI